MKSHTCDFDWKDLWSLVVFRLGVVILFAAAMHLGAALQLLPRPRPALDVDRTILVHQAEASRSTHAATLLLVGDSSCLMDVSARQLGERLQSEALNLGTLSYLDLNAYAGMLREYSNANPGRLRAVVLLMHPEALRRSAPESYHVELLQKYYAAEDHCPKSGLWDRIDCLFGFEIFKGRLLGRLLPVPLPGAFGRRYGFNADLENFMTRHHGSVVEPESKSFEGDAEYSLARALEPASRAFRAAVPPGTRLIAGITPAPERFAQPNFKQRHAAMLEQWGGWLEADALLSELPATLPDAFFANQTHLNEAAAFAYTEILARYLEARLK